MMEEERGRKEGQVRETGRAQESEWLCVACVCAPRVPHPCSLLSLAA